MKKWMTILVAVMLVLSMTTAFAAGVPSKTTTDTTTIVGITSATGAQLPEGFEVQIVPDTAMTVDLIDKLVDHTKAGNDVIDFFDPEIQNEILNHLNANKPATEALTLDDLRPWQIYEIVSIDAVNAEDDMSDVIVTFQFATPYKMDQRMVGIMDNFNGERVEVEPNVFEFVSEKTVLDAEVTAVTEEGSQVAVTFPAEAIMKIQDSVASTLSIFSEPLE